MISKLSCVLDDLSKGCVFQRIRKNFPYVFVDEIQDFAGYDLEVIRKLHEVGCSVTLVGDPRQTTYRTHYEAKYKKYAGGKIINFVQENIPEMNIDSTTLSTSYRNNQIICNLANKMYPDMEPCDSAMNVKTEHDGIFWIEEKDIDNLLDFNFMRKQLKYEDSVIITLYYMEGFSDKEIGNILKLKENTVKTKRTRAKQKIREILDIGGKNNG